MPQSTALPLVLYTLIIGVICLFSFEFVSAYIEGNLEGRKSPLKRGKGKGETYWDKANWHFRVSSATFTLIFLI